MFRLFSYAAIIALALVACSGGTSTNPMATAPGVSTSNAPMPMGAQTTNARDTDNLANDVDVEDPQPMLKDFTHQTTIGSTVDPVNGAVNPYGLAIAPVSAGNISAGDLVVCNFNDSANVQGTGTSLIALHPTPGSVPRAISQSRDLRGCNALSLAGPDLTWTADFSANNVGVFSATGTLEQLFENAPFDHPFGMMFAAHPGAFGNAAFYESNAGDGSIVRFGLHPGSAPTIEVIATGFAVNHGVPGSILAPSGLAYNPTCDRLYIVDGTNNTVVALRHVSTIPANGIVVAADGRHFSGPFAHRARLVYAGAPLNGPISSALLPNGHLAVGNTLDPDGKNLIVELSPGGRVLEVKNVDTGAAGAIFGMVASGTNTQNTKLYFNDDNANAVMVLTR